MKRKKIAIIGGGGAGITAAWSLNKKYDVRLFESESNLGGHAYSHELNLPEGDAHIDMGVEYFNEKLSPNLCAFLELLGVDSFIAPLSFRAVFSGENNQWSNINFDGALREQLHEEFERFHSDMMNLANTQDEHYLNISIGEFLDEKGYSEAFRFQALYPLMTIYLGCNAPAKDYNLMYVVFSFNMNLLSLFSSGYWRKAKGGIYKYVQIIEKELEGKIELNSRVQEVQPTDEGVLVKYNDTKFELFDEVVFATHADVTLKILEEVSPMYRQVLGEFEYAPVSSYLHFDDQVLQSKTGQEYFEFSMPSLFDLATKRDQPGALTRIYNNLFYYKKFAAPLLVTFDPQTPIDQEKIKAERHWKLPKLRPVDFKRRQQIQQIQGLNNCWFCGTDTSLTGHEGAIVSALVIAEKLGVEYIFANDQVAVNQYNIIKDFMGFKTPDQVNGSEKANSFETLKTI